MKTAIYTPYLDTIGGGEKYMMTIAEVLSAQGEVDVLLDYHLVSLDMQLVKKQIEELHGLNLSKINFKKAPLGRGSSFLERLVFLRGYDWFFYLTDGSVFIPAAKNNIIHFQVPFSNTSAQGLKGKIKLLFWKEAIYNSCFTKEIVEKSWSFPGRVIYPPVDIEKIKPLTKREQIVSVGRFHSATKTKKHELIIKTFDEFIKNNRLSNWSLHLAGGMEEGNDGYLNELKELSKGLPVFFYPNMPLKDLYKLYGESMIYWHFKGFKEEDPKNFEHFGITTVEAMAGGCVPVVINKGGQQEIVEEGVSGFRWDNFEELTDKTLLLIKDPDLRKKTAEKALIRSQEFSKERFSAAILKLILDKNR